MKCTQKILYFDTWDKSDLTKNPSFFVTSSSTLYFFFRTHRLIERSCGQIVESFGYNNLNGRLEETRKSCQRRPTKFTYAPNSHRVSEYYEIFPFGLTNLPEKQGLSELLWYQTPSFRCHWRERSNSFNFFWTPRRLPLKIGVHKCTKLLLICKERFSPFLKAKVLYVHNVIHKWLRSDFNL